MTSTAPFTRLSSSLMPNETAICWPTIELLLSLRRCPARRSGLPPLIRRTSYVRRPANRATWAADPGFGRSRFFGHANGHHHRPSHYRAGADRRRAAATLRRRSGPRRRGWRRRVGLHDWPGPGQRAHARDRDPGRAVLSDEPHARRHGPPRARPKLDLRPRRAGRPRGSGRPSRASERADKRPGTERPGAVATHAAGRLRWCARRAGRAGAERTAGAAVALEAVEQGPVYRPFPFVDENAPLAVCLSAGHRGSWMD